MCAEMYMQAVQRFDGQYGAASCLKHIHFADISDEMVSNIQAVFKQKMNNVASCQHGDNMQEVRSLDTTQQNSSGMMQEVLSVSTEQNKGETTHPDSSINAGQKNAKDKMPSAAVVGSTQQNMTHMIQSLTCVDSPQQSTNPTTLALTSGMSVSAACHSLDFHSITNLKKEPAVTVTESFGKFGAEWRICFHEVEYFIGQLDISQITTDAVIFWHIDGRPIEERSLKKFLTSNEFTAFKKKQVAEEKIHILKGNKCKWLVFVVVPPLNRGSLEAVTSRVEKALLKVDNHEAKSVALLQFSHSKGE